MDSPTILRKRKVNSDKTRLFSLFRKPQNGTQQSGEKREEHIHRLCVRPELRSTGTSVSHLLPTLPALSEESNFVTDFDLTQDYVLYPYHSTGMKQKAGSTVRQSTPELEDGPSQVDKAPSQSMRLKPPRESLPARDTSHIDWRKPADRLTGATSLDSLHTAWVEDGRFSRSRQARSGKTQDLDHKQNRSNHVVFHSCLPNDEKRNRRFSTGGTSTGTTSEPTSNQYFKSLSTKNDLAKQTLLHDPSSLPPLQQLRTVPSPVKNLRPSQEDDPNSWDLYTSIAPVAPRAEHLLERLSELLFSRAHLHNMLNDPSLLSEFAEFMLTRRSDRYRILLDYVRVAKFLHAITYANSIVQTSTVSDAAGPLENNSRLLASVTVPEWDHEASKLLSMLQEEDLPAFVAYKWTMVVSASAEHRIRDKLPTHLRNASEGLGEVFCITDPSKEDNPIIFVSEEFTRTTQYGMQYTVGRNCRFLQGPRTGAGSIRRIREACANSHAHNEVFLNYRRDGSPFINLLMLTPLVDAEGTTKYFLGAQVDVSGLLLECSGFGGLRKVKSEIEGLGRQKPDNIEAIKALSQLLDQNELNIVQENGGQLHLDTSKRSTQQGTGPRVVLRDTDLGHQHEDMEVNYGHVRKATESSLREQLPGVYGNVSRFSVHWLLRQIDNHIQYLLVREAPALRILFVSPSLEEDNILQRRLTDCIGGSQRLRENLTTAFEDGRAVTAKISWIGAVNVRTDQQNRTAMQGSSDSSTSDHTPVAAVSSSLAWIHCTPLLDQEARVGVWMVILVYDEIRK